MGENKIPEQYSALSTAEQTFLKAFLHNFSLTWYREFARKGTRIGAFLLKPDKSLADAGYGEELLLAYSGYDSLEPRSLQVCEELFADPDLYGRVEPYAFFLVSDAVNVREKFTEIGSAFFSTRMALVFSTSELVANCNNPWYIRQRFLESIASRDLFDLRLPLHDEFGFFGRKDILSTIIDSVRRSENVGIFGLRKVGKTSVLFRARDLCLSQDIATVLYIDCKRPDIWSLSWKELLAKVLEELRLAAHDTAHSGHITTLFLRAIADAQRRVLLIFDEIEYISPESTSGPHWNTDFIPLWQTIWSAQSEHKKLSVVVAGVNSGLVERSLIKKIQNPLFSIVKPYYLRGLKDEDLRSMVRHLGRKSGLTIDFSPAMWLFERYGGHPLLTRLSCSVLNNYIREQRESRPFVVTVDYLNGCAELLDSGILYYAEHVISSLKQSFGSEYLLLESLALGRRADFHDHAKNPAAIRHLRDYGLIRTTGSGYEIAIEILRKYIISSNISVTGKLVSRWIVPHKQRNAWVSERIYRILKDFRMLDKLLGARGAVMFGPNTLPESEVFGQSAPVRNSADWQLFINATNRTFVESVEQYGKSKGLDQYFWDQLKAALPHLWDALNRIKLYRNDQMHLVLRGTVLASYERYLIEDLGTTAVTTLGEDVYFMLQQGVLDGLLNSLQIETAKLGD